MGSIYQDMLDARAIKDVDSELKIVQGHLYKLPSGSVVKVTRYGKEDVREIGDGAGVADVVHCIYVMSTDPRARHVTLLRDWFQQHAARSFGA